VATSSKTPEYLFDLDAGRLCLDFVNTHSRRTGEHLASYADVVAFVRQSGLLTQAEADRLRRQAARQPGDAEALLTRAHALRDALFAIFSAIAAGRQPPEADMDAFNFALATTLSHARVLPTPRGSQPQAQGPAFVWGWAGDRGASLETPLWHVVRSAADLLASAEARSVRECGAPDCRWLFLDTSKNRSRQWCSMQSCGNREKARRHYQRVRSTREPAARPRRAPRRRSSSASQAPLGRSSSASRAPLDG
jgi:predicted RNA-binding Zn ribbon-like protein